MRMPYRTPNFLFIFNFGEPNRGSFLLYAVRVLCMCSLYMWVDTAGPYWSWDYLTGLWDQLPVTWSGCNQPDLNPTDHRTYIPELPGLGHHKHLRALGLQYRIGVCTPAVYMYTCTINGGDLSAVDIVYGWKVEAMFFLGSNAINPILSI